MRQPTRSGRIADIQQYDFDRVIEFAVDRGGGRNYLIVELFPKGSMVLLDESRRILTMLRKMIYRGHKMAAGEMYLSHPTQQDPRTISSEDLLRMLTASGQDLVISVPEFEYMAVVVIGSSG